MELWLVFFFSTLLLFSKTTNWSFKEKKKKKTKTKTKTKSVAGGFSAWEIFFFLFWKMFDARGKHRNKNAKKFGVKTPVCAFVFVFSFWRRNTKRSSRQNHAIYGSQRISLSWSYFIVVAVSRFVFQRKILEFVLNRASFFLTCKLSLRLAPCKNYVEFAFEKCLKKETKHKNNNKSAPVLFTRFLTSSRRRRRRVFCCCKSL